MKHYFTMIFNVLFTVVTFGFILPGLISAADTVLVIAGVIWLVAVYVPVMYYTNRKYFTQLINKCKGMQ